MARVNQVAKFRGTSKTEDGCGAFAETKKTAVAAYCVGIRLLITWVTASATSTAMAMTHHCLCTTRR